MPRRHLQLIPAQRHVPLTPCGWQALHSKWKKSSNAFSLRDVHEQVDEIPHRALRRLQSPCRAKHDFGTSMPAKPGHRPLIPKTGLSQEFVGASVSTPYSQRQQAYDGPRYLVDTKGDVHAHRVLSSSALLCMQQRAGADTFSCEEYMWVACKPTSHGLQLHAFIVYSLLRASTPSMARPCNAFSASLFPLEPSYQLHGKLKTPCVPSLAGACRSSRRK